MLQVKFRGRRPNGEWVEGAYIPAEYTQLGYASILTLDDRRFEVDPETVEIYCEDIRPKGPVFKVFDWDKAARIIKERNPQRALAGLTEDWFWTGGTIWKEGQICTADPPYLLSSWATPVIILEDEGSREEIDCWRLYTETEWDEHTNWPESARKILGEQDG